MDQREETPHGWKAGEWDNPNEEPYLPLKWKVALIGGAILIWFVGKQLGIPFFE